MSGGFFGGFGGPGAGGFGGGPGGFGFRRPGRFRGWPRWFRRWLGQASLGPRRTRAGPEFGPGGRPPLKRAAFVTAALLLDGPADAAQIVQRVSDATDGAFTPPHDVAELAIGLLAGRGVVTVDNGVATLTELGKNLLAWRGGQQRNRTCFPGAGGQVRRRVQDPQGNVRDRRAGTHRSPGRAPTSRRKSSPRPGPRCWKPCARPRRRCTASSAKVDAGGG